jgi:hypothetical protein
MHLHLPYPLPSSSKQFPLPITIRYYSTIMKFIFAIATLLAFIGPVFGNGLMKISEGEKRERCYLSLPPQTLLEDVLKRCGPRKEA